MQWQKFNKYSVVLLTGLWAHSAAAQVGCSVHWPCTNPVPVVSISTTPSSVWDDNQGLDWRISSSNGIVSGTVTRPNPAGGSCPIITFDASGGITPSIQLDYVQGYTDFTWYGTNPRPAETCGGWTPIPFTYSGTIQNNGNDWSGNILWVNEDGSQGTARMDKLPHDIPSSETTMAVGFSSGDWATVGQFRQILNDSYGRDDIFKGRQVTEYTGWTGPRYDNCWFEGSQVQKWTDVEGAAWNVGYYAIYPPYITSLNTWADDYIGLNAAQVKYYRDHRPGPFVCGVRVPQQMFINVYGTSGNLDDYSLGYVGQDIYTDHVTVIRNGVSQSTNQ